MSGQPGHVERNQEIVRRFVQGDRWVDIAQWAGVSDTRIQQIIRAHVNRTYGSDETARREFYERATRAAVQRYPDYAKRYPDYAV